MNKLRNIALINLIELYQEEYSRLLTLKEAKKLLIEMRKSKQ